MPPPILVICPSRGRPGNVDQAILSHRATTDGLSDFLVAIDEDEAHKYPRHPGILYDIRPRKRMIPRFNEVAVEQALRYKAICFIGDDHRFRTPHWEALATSRIDANNGWGIVYGDDKFKGQELATAAILSSNVINTLGYVCPQTMLHMCMDVVWMDIGRETGILSYVPEIVIEHMHPMCGKAQFDAGYDSLFETIGPDQLAYYAWEKQGKASDVAKIRAAMKKQS